MKRSSIMGNPGRAFVCVCFSLFLVTAADASLTSFGNTNSATTFRLPPGSTNEPIAQGTLPGAILTPMFRLDINATFVESGTEVAPNDFVTELMSIRLRVELRNGARAKDLDGIAIAREGSDVFAAADPFLSPIGEDGTAIPDLANTEALPRRFGSSADPPDSRFGIYTPDEDPLIAYAPMSTLLNDPDHPLSPFATDFTITFNLSDDSGMGTNSGVPTPFFTGEPTLSDDILPGDALSTLGLNEDTPDLIRRANFIVNANLDGDAFATFYALVSLSPSIQDGASIQVTLDVGNNETPRVRRSLGRTDNFASQPNRFVRYFWGENRQQLGDAGLVIQIPQPACEEVEEEEIKFCEIPQDVYGPPGTVIPAINPVSGIIVVNDLVADQVPLRKLDGVFDGDPISGGVEIPVPGSNQIVFENRIWSQFPPGYPPVNPARDAPLDPIDNIFPIPVGRVHPDSNISTGTYPSPEVLTAGEQTYAWFGFDYGGGWAGGYDWRISDFFLEVQGLGSLGEIPRDNFDNDGDGLIDEVGVQDTPFDRLLPGRNDDVDFFFDLGAPTRTGLEGTAVDGSPLTPGELDLINSAVIERGYNPPWDPIFPVRHVWDDSRGAGASDPDLFGDDPQFFRDVVIALNPDGLTGRKQPELGIRFTVLENENPARGQYLASLLRIGALQSRGVDEDGDGEDGSPVSFGFKISDGEDNDGDGLTDEGIDEEVENGFDDDGDGLVDEDLNFVPVLLAIDEELNSFFVDGPGGRFQAFDEGVDFVYFDFDLDGVYDDGRNDDISPNLDEFQGPGSSPLRNGDSYHEGQVLPLDEDLDFENEDGNPLTPPPVFDGIDNDGDGLTDEGANEDVRDAILGDPRVFRANFPISGVIRQTWLWEDVNNNARHDPGFRVNQAAGGDGLVSRDNNLLGLPNRFGGFSSDIDRYSLFYNLIDGASPGPDMPIHQDSRYDFFVGFRIPPNMPLGSDFQVTLYPRSVNVEFDTRPNFNPGTLRYPSTGDGALVNRFSALDGLATLNIPRPAKSNAYQITKRQFAHLEIADAMGFQSRLEVDGGYRGRPYLDGGSFPTPILAINMADAIGNNETALGISTDATGGVDESFSVMDSIRVNFDPVVLDGGLFNPAGTGGDLRPLSDRIFSDPDTGQQFADSGVSLYLDNKTGGEIGAFDRTDTPIPLNAETMQWNADPTDPVAVNGGYYVVLRPEEGVRVPNTDFFEVPNNPDLTVLDPNRGYDLFVVVRTNNFAGARNAFRGYIRPGDITFTNGFNTIGSGCVTHTYTLNVPIVLSSAVNADQDLVDDAADTVEVIPRSNTVPVLGFNLFDENQTFGDEPTRLATLSVRFDNQPSGAVDFTPSDLSPLTGDIVRNIPLDPAEDNDNDPRTFAIPDGIDNDNDGLTDEGLGNSLIFDPNRYTSLSGVALFRDMPNSDRNGVFDDPLDPNVINPDLPVFLSGDEQFSFPIGTSAYLVLALDHDPVSLVNELDPGKGDPVDPPPFETIPEDDIGVNRGSDYFVVIRTSKTISNGDNFRVGTGTFFADLDPVFAATVIGTPFGFMPGATSGIGPDFPQRQPYDFDPLINARLVPSIPRVAEQPLSPGNLFVPGQGLIPIDDPAGPFDLYEAYNRSISRNVLNIEDGNDEPALEFIVPAFDEETSSEENVVPGTIFLRWSDIDEDSPDATVTLLYFPIVVDPLLGELFPVIPNDPRFDFQLVTGVLGALDIGDQIDDFTIITYEDVLLSDDNENVNPVTGLGNDIFTWDARLVTPGIYRVGAVLSDGENPDRIVVSGRIIITNDRPILVLTEPAP